MFKNKKVIAVIAIVFLLVLSAGIAGALVYSSFNQRTLNEQPQTILVKKGDTLLKLCNKLVVQGLIADCFGVKVMAKVSAELTQIKTGLYNVESNKSLAQLIADINQGKELQFSFTIVEGENIYQVLDKLKNKKHLKNDLNNLSLADLATKLNLTSPSPEGWLFPDTYYYSANSKSSDLLKRAVVRQQQVLERLWQQRAETNLLVNKYEALILASIVEKESSHAAERETIASVFHNRLNKKMRLQTDPTVIYGIWHEYDGDITRKHLNQKTAYNTYRINGLPPTPIANPSADSIEAVLKPAKTDYFYFVASGNGGHVFNKTLEQHNRAVRNYLRKQRLERMKGN